MLSLSLSVITILIFHIWRVVGPPPATVSNLEYDRWRGKAALDDMDMLEISNWMAQLNDSQIADSLKYYWANNEVMYPYAALVRGMFAVFNESTKEKKIVSFRFLRGIEVTIHYILLKSYPVIGRRGGIRGTGQDKLILKAAIPSLIACYNKFTEKQNFTERVFPIVRRRKKRRVLLHPIRFTRNRSHSFRGKREGEEGLESDQPASDGDLAPPPPSPDEEEKNAIETTMGTDASSPIRGRYSYALSHGSQSKAKVTNIVVADDDTTKQENVAVSIYWLIYELIPPLCGWTTMGDINPYKEAFDKVLGLVVSMYLYDKTDFAEEYERIFNMTTHAFETEWEKVEFFAKGLQKEKKLHLTTPYSDVL